MPDHFATRYPDSCNTVAIQGYSVGLLGSWLAGLVRSDDHGVLIIDQHRRIVIANAEAARIFGHSLAALPGNPIDMLLPARVRASHAHQLARFTAARVAGRRLRVKLDLQGRRGDGTEFFLGASLSRLALNGEGLLAAVVQELAPHQRPDTSPIPMHGQPGSSQKVNEMEKRHFSRALYEEVGQGLSVLKLDLDWCERQAAQPRIGKRLAEMQALLDEVILSTKNIASSLRPPLLDDFGVVAAAEWLTARFGKRTGIPCHLKCRNEALHADGVIESAVFRIIQEALSNIEQHASARTVCVRLWQSRHRVHVVVEDDGIGLHYGWKNKPDALGLMAMQERVTLLRGTMQLKNLRPSGVALLASLPVAPASTAARHA